jgi:hypothetical protein
MLQHVQFTLRPFQAKLPVLLNTKLARSFLKAKDCVILGKKSAVPYSEGEWGCELKLSVGGCGMVGNKGGGGGNDKKGKRDCSVE